MAFKLRIRFTGMCLFVRDGDRFVHVLLPSTGGAFPMPAADGGNMAGMEGMKHMQAPSQAALATPAASPAPTAPAAPAEMRLDPHTARITFDTAHLCKDRVTLDTHLAHVSLKGRMLEFPREGSRLNSKIPTDLVSLGGKLKPAVFENSADAQELLTSRLTFASGQCTGVAPGRCWSWMGETRRMSHVVEWTVDDYPGETLTIALKQFAGAEGGTVGPLYPVNGVVALTVWHAPYSDLPPDPIPVPEPVAGQNVRAHHFAAMLRLLQDPPLEVPVYVGGDCGRSSDVREELEDALHDDGKGSASVSCMGGHGG